jgi:nicotinate-nucleotide adenylyltransferase
MGGTFDPVHIGHLIAAEESRARLELDEVLFIPTGLPWRKAGRPITEGHHRLAMVQRAIRGNPYFRATDMELARPGPTYTVDTLCELRRGFGSDTTLYLILGQDTLPELWRWRQPQRLLEMCTLVCVSRPGFQNFDPKSLDALSAGASPKIILLECPLIEVSGAELRRRVSHGLSIKYQVPESVEDYIYEHGLYGSRARSKASG